VGGPWRGGAGDGNNRQASAGGQAGRRGRPRVSRRARTVVRRRPSCAAAPEGLWRGPATARRRHVVCFASKHRVPSWNSRPAPAGASVHKNGHIHERSVPDKSPGNPHSRFRGSECERQAREPGHGCGGRRRDREAAYKYCPAATSSTARHSGALPCSSLRTCTILSPVRPDIRVHPSGSVVLGRSSFSRYSSATAACRS
jgi:hypothetical protein